MARPLQVTIVESREQLERRLDAQTTATGKERLQMLYWLKLGIVNSRQDLVKLLHKSEATITRWLGMYNSGGLTHFIRDQTRSWQSRSDTSRGSIAPKGAIETATRLQ